MFEKISPTSSESHSAEHARRVKQLEKIIEGRLLGREAAHDVPHLEETFAHLSVREKADTLYEKLMAYAITQNILAEERLQNPGLARDQQEPADPYLVAEIRYLWEDQRVRALFTDRASAALVDRKLYLLSEAGRHWQTINQEIDEVKGVFEAETRALFLQKVSRPDQVSAARSRIARFAKEIIRLQEEQRRLITLKDLPHVPEYTDIASQIMFETISHYHDQLKNGFVWLPSRVDIHVKTLEALQNGRWPVLRGEAGTGKSEQADAAALVLTGEQPTHLTCSYNTGEQDLISDKAIDPDTRGSYEEYKPAMEAATGYEDSRQQEPSVATGRIVRFDESGRLGNKGYSVIKELRQKRPARPDDLRRFYNGETIDVAKTLHGRPVLPGFAAIFTTNPEGSRYPDRTEPDAALRRELSYIVVDYPPQTAENPELYEFMLACLMDDNHHIAVSAQELAPTYIMSPKTDTLPDGRLVTAEQTLIDDATYPQHGVLYRLSFAIRALQDCFNNGNASSIPNDALRFNYNNSGQIEISKTSGDLLTLSNSTITLGEVASWMRGFRDRRLKDDPTYQTKTLTEWIQVKLGAYLEQVDEVDREKVAVIFNHFRLFDPAPNVSHALPITPKEIGYLSPRTPRALQVESGPQENQPNRVPVKAEQHLNTDIQCMLEDGSTVLVSPKGMTLQQNGVEIRLRPGSRFILEDEEFQYAGVDASDRVVAKITALKKDEALHLVFDPRLLEESAEFDLIEEYAQELFGRDFLGPEQVAEALDIEIPWDMVPEIPFTEDELDQAFELGQYLILRVDQDADGTPLTIANLNQRLQERFRKKGHGSILWDTSWYEDEEFFLNDPPRLKWALATRELMPESTSKDYLDQTLTLAEYVRNQVFKDIPLTEEFEEALAELDRQKTALIKLRDDVNAGRASWQDLAKKLVGLKINQLGRQKPSEAVYDSLVMLETNNERLLEERLNWAVGMTSDSRLVYAGEFDADGLDVSAWYPRFGHEDLGVVFSR